MVIPPKPYASGTIALSRKQPRFTIPAEVLASAGWNDLDEVEELVAEFIDVGHYKLHRLRDIESNIAAAKACITNEAPTTQQEADELQLLADQFRVVRLYKSDNNRVAIKEEVASILVSDSNECGPYKLYIQASNGNIDIMSPTVRIKRLKSFVEK
ncbi:hypothetical protein [Magnetovibrio blakemorei]|uniref:Uncharacterized protein n=1 Tax=Magnetovibrio blakemorei TaxID=28181 RepID=A0A1E5Q382_9PROT|nr:hypothetical protein [Magnetovibrio blakemorei]OEJ64083.1 hypothetical protein BEN30_01375 [Magnetovibrio blakemorei]